MKTIRIISRKSLLARIQANIVAEKIKLGAEEGMLSTRDIMATKGRASFLGERAIGHIDPGARSSQLAISAICDEYIN